MSKELVSEWIRKAEEDWQVLDRLAAGDSAGIAGPLAFHAQQCIEKYLKALLLQVGVEPPRTHSLEVLTDLLSGPGIAGAETWRDRCGRLSPYAVAFRYPGDPLSVEDAREAVALARSLREELRVSLGGARATLTDDNRIV